jgi:hypothetical protein
MSDEYGWKDRDDCRGRVIGYGEVRLHRFLDIRGERNYFAHRLWGDAV